MRRGHLFWPVVLIVVGGVWLLDNLRIIDIDILAIIVPVILIGIGISIMLNSFGGTRASETKSLSIPLEGAEKARLKIGYGAGRITLRAGARAGELLSGTFGDGVEHRVRHSDGTLDVALQMPSVAYSPFNWSGSDRRWTVDLNGGIPLDLNLEIGAVEARLDLAELRVTNLSLHTGASSTELTLPAKAGHTQVSIEAGAASLNIHVPQGVAIRVHSDSALSDIKIDANRFPRRENGYESPEFGNAENRAEIKIGMGVGSVKIG
jgi:hypothetical protein